VKKPAFSLFETPGSSTIFTDVTELSATLSASAARREYETLVKRKRGAISLPPPTITPKYRLPALENNVAGNAVTLPNRTLNTPFATVTLGCVSVQSAVPPEATL
jgi:hypothetical protein